MPDPASDSGLSPDDLTALLERLEARRAGARNAGEPARADVEFLLARASVLTEALRTAPANDTARLAARLLLDDLAAIAAQFRGNADAVRASLTATLDDLRGALDVR